MDSFFEKLKKGMGVEEPNMEEETEKTDEIKEETVEPEPEKKPKNTRKPEKAKKAPEFKIRKLEVQTETPEEEIKEEMPEEPKGKEEKNQPSLSKEEEGQLAIDVYQTEDNLVIQSAIAGVKPENLEISMERDIITIKGSRENPFEENGDYFVQECFWGPFSREIIAPVEVDAGRAMAEMKNGIMIIKIPKILKDKKRKIIVRG